MTAATPAAAADGAPVVAPQALRDYAFLADGYRGAFIGHRGDVSWLCAPTGDSPAVLANLVGGRGCYLICPADTFVWGGHDKPGASGWSLISRRKSRRGPAVSSKLRRSDPSRLWRAPTALDQRQCRSPAGDRPDPRRPRSGCRWARS